MRREMLECCGHWLLAEGFGDVLKALVMR